MRAVVVQGRHRHGPRREVDVLRLRRHGVTEAVVCLRVVHIGIADVGLVARPDHQVVAAGQRPGARRLRPAAVGVNQVRVDGPAGGQPGRRAGLHVRQPDDPVDRHVGSRCRGLQRRRQQAELRRRVRAWAGVVLLRLDGRAVGIEQQPAADVVDGAGGGLVGAGEAALADHDPPHRVLDAAGGGRRGQPVEVQRVSTRRTVAIEVQRGRLVPRGARTVQLDKQRALRHPHLVEGLHGGAAGGDHRHAVRTGFGALTVGHGPPLGRFVVGGVGDAAVVAGKTFRHHQLRRLAAPNHAEVARRVRAPGAGAILRAVRRVNVIVLQAPFLVGDEIRVVLERHHDRVVGLEADGVDRPLGDPLRPQPRLLCEGERASTPWWAPGHWPHCRRGASPST